MSTSYEERLNQWGHWAPDASGTDTIVVVPHVEALNLCREADAALAAARTEAEALRAEVARLRGDCAEAVSLIGSLQRRLVVKYPYGADECKAFIARFMLAERAALSPTEPKEE